MGIDNPLTPFLKGAGYAVLDGALATELERRGADLRDPLWSAKLLIEAPGLIEQVHFDYYCAGADVATTASYQATIEGFRRRGVPRGEAEQLLTRSVELARAARMRFWTDDARRVGRIWPLVAASVGPYGAFLADGSEYRGDYGRSVEELMAFHRPRLERLIASRADLLAFETIPCLTEAEVLARLLAEYQDAQAWLSFSCRDEESLCSGEPFADGVAIANASAQVVAVGLNCTAPRFATGLLERAAQTTAKPLVVYPNRGDRWDNVARQWVTCGVDVDFGTMAREWFKAGARLIGGCCRTTPDDICTIRTALQCHGAV